MATATWALAVERRKCHDVEDVGVLVAIFLVGVFARRVFTTNLCRMYTKEDRWVTTAFSRLPSSRIKARSKMAVMK